MSNMNHALPLPANRARPARHFPVRRAYFRRVLAAELPMKDAIQYRKAAAYATNEEGRRRLRIEMRYYAQKAVDQVRRYILNEATNAFPNLY